MSEEINKSICSTCKHMFCDKYSLQKHLKLNKCREPPTCSRCKKSFLRNCDLTRHLARKNLCNVTALPSNPDQYYELKNRELELEEKKLDIMKELKIKELEVEYKKLEVKERVEEAKLKRKQTTSKISINNSTINNGTINNTFILNIDETPKKAIDGLTRDISYEGLSSADPMVYSIKYVYDNPDYPEHRSIVCVNKAYEIFRCRIDGEWKQIRDFNVIDKPIRNNSIDVINKMFKLIAASGTNEERIANITKFSSIVNEHNMELNRPEPELKYIIIDSLPQVADQSSG